MNIFAWWNSDRVVLGMHNAQPIGPEEAPRLYELTAGLAGRAAYIQVISNDFFQKQGEIRFERVGVFAHGQGLAGQGRLVDEKIAGRQHTHIGGHQIAGRQVHHVTGHQLRDGQLLRA